MNKPWQDLTDEIVRWNDAGRVIEFWWRDDDAGRPNPAFSRLLQLAGQFHMPLGVAAIPQRAETELFNAFEGDVAVLQHGVDHRNRAPLTEKPSEFPSTESIEVALSRIAQGAERLSALAGSRLLPVLVPPWNRFSKLLIEHLPRHATRGFSAFGPRAHAEPVPGLRQVNTHIDIIAWKRGRTFVGEERALSEAVSHLAKRRAGTVDAAEPTGWLTHHERHDETIWSFLARLFDYTRTRDGVRWLHPRDVFLGGPSR